MQGLADLGLQGPKHVADAAASVHGDELVLLGQFAEFVYQRRLVLDEVLVEVGPAQKVLARFPVIQLPHRQHPRHQVLDVYIKV